MKKYSDYVRLIYVLGLLCLVTSLSGCDVSNTNDPNLFIQITQGPKDNQTVSEDKVSFFWSGSDDSYEYKYKFYLLKPNGALKLLDSTAWSVKTKVVFSSLDDGKYKFVVYGKYNGVTSSTSRIFSVDAIKGPVLKFFKTKTVAALQDTINISLWMEDIDRFVAGNIQVLFANDYLRLTAVTGVNFDDFKDASFSQLILPETDEAFYLKSNSSGIINFNTAVMMNAFSKTESLSGSGSIIELKFIPLKAGTTQLIFSDLTKLKDQDDKVIKLNSFKEATVEIY